MSKWNKISLFKFQQIEAISNKKDMPDLDKALFSTCVVFNMTEYQMDNAGLKKATRLTKKVSAIYETALKPVPAKKIGQFIINYDVQTMTFGQFVELSFFLPQKPDDNPIHNAHYIMATISRRRFKNNQPKDHRKKADYFLNQCFTKFVGSLVLIQERYKNFVDEYKSLFGLPAEVHGEVQEDRFNKRYGWVYAASQVAEYERITLDEAFGLPVRQAFNDLAYLKAKSIYEIGLLKKKPK